MPSRLPLPSSHVPAWLRGAFVAAALLGAMESARAESGGETTQENQKKAEFIASFTRFIEWPERKFAHPNSPFIIGVYGSDKILALLRETLAGRQIKGRNVVVQYLSNEEELRACHVLFISRTERDRLGPILGEVRRENVLTVGECENFLGQGGVINFHNAAGSVRFQISMAAAGREKLTVSSKLLQLAIPERVRPIFAR